VENFVLFFKFKKEKKRNGANIIAGVVFW